MGWFSGQRWPARAAAGNFASRRIAATRLPGCRSTAQAVPPRSTLAESGNGGAWRGVQGDAAESIRPVHFAPGRAANATQSQRQSPSRGMPPRGSNLPVGAQRSVPVPTAGNCAPGGRGAYTAMRVLPAALVSSPARGARKPGGTGRTKGWRTSPLIANLKPSPGSARQGFPDDGIQQPLHHFSGSLQIGICSASWRARCQIIIQRLIRVWLCALAAREISVAVKVFIYGRRRSFWLSAILYSGW